MKRINKQMLIMGIISASMILTSCGIAQKAQKAEEDTDTEYTEYSKIDKEAEEVSRMMVALKDDSYRIISGEPFGEYGVNVLVEISRSIFNAGEQFAVKAHLEADGATVLIPEGYDGASGKLILTSEETGEKIQQELESKGGSLSATYSIDTPGTYEAQVMISDEDYGTGYSNVFPITVTDPSTAEGQAESEKPHDQWRGAYIELIKDLKENADAGKSYCYDMAQLDVDGIPELLVSVAEAEQQDGVRIYAFENGKISETGEFGSWGNVEYVAGESMIIDTKGSDSSSVVQTFYLFLRTSVRERSQLCITEGETVTYYVDGEETNKSVYEDAFSELVGFPRNEITVKGSSTGRSLTDTYTAEDFVNSYPWYSHMDFWMR